ncbi:MAG: DUF1849 family protein, partial [Alphaproteobacteria bacterium]|nr:DUF1849 family protein [Alphaproteobacteria bacterium]
RGQASKCAKEVEVSYQKPNKVTLKLPENTLFPLEYTQGLLKIAEEGEHMYPAVVFDGSNTEGPSEIDVFVGEKKVMTENSAIEGTHQFAAQPFWPVRFSVYGEEGGQYEAEYTTTQELLPNGIIKQYVVDDGTIKIRGVLDRVEVLPKEGVNP